MVERQSTYPNQKGPIQKEEAKAIKLVDKDEK